MTTPHCPTCRCGKPLRACLACQHLVAVHSCLTGPCAVPDCGCLHAKCAAGEGE